MLPFTQAQRRLLARLRSIVGDDPNIDPRRVAALIRAVSEEVADLEHVAAATIYAELTSIYRAGHDQFAARLGTDLQFSQIRVDAARALAKRQVETVASQLRDTEAATKTALRRLARSNVENIVINGTPAKRAAQLFTDDVQSQLGLFTVRYSNDAEHTVADWAEMAVRTESAMAYNSGTFDTAAELDIGWFECLDSPDCGLDGHDDPEKPDGNVYSADDADSYSISHPSCVRDWAPRPDVQSQDDADAANQATADGGPSASDGQPPDTSSPLTAPTEPQGRQPREPREPRASRSGDESA